MSINPEPKLPDGAIAHRNLAYVANGHERQKLDVYLPAQPGEARWPLIVWIHGGAFRMGSKEGDAHNLVPIDYVSRGYAVASINYRLSQHASWPAQIEDCKAAVRWLRAHSDDYGINPLRIASWGPSAGGHLAAMLGVTGHIRELDVGAHLDRLSSVQCVVDYFGPTDFLQMDAQRPPGGMIHDTPDSPESELIGGPIQQNKEATARANPVTYVTADAPPFLIIHGDADPLVPFGQSELLRDALTQVGVSATLYAVAGAGHGNFSDPVVPRMTRTFLDAQLKPA